jgi:hypothetical protein
MGICCQWWFSALWFDGGRKANQMTYAFPCRLSWDPSVLVECWRRRTTVAVLVRTTLWWSETNYPRNNLSAKQIKTQNKAICFFIFLYKFQTTNVHLDTYRFQALSWPLWPSICVGSKGPRMICTPTWMRRKTRNHYVSHYHFPCKDHKWRWITWRFFPCQRLGSSTSTFSTVALVPVIHWLASIRVSEQAVSGTKRR